MRLFPYKEMKTAVNPLFYSSIFLGNAQILSVQQADAAKKKR
jgi:hypothetical protein